MSKKNIRFQGFTWYNLESPDENDLENLKKTFHFHSLDIKECLHFSQRSKIDLYNDYAFIILLFPSYDRRTRQINAAQIKIFISKKYLIIIHQKEFPVLSEIWKLFEKNAEIRDTIKDGSPERLLYEILNRLFLYCFPMIDHLIDDCDRINQSIFSNNQLQNISEILVIRRNITDFRKIAQVHKNVLKKLIGYLRESSLFIMKKTDVYFESLTDYTKEIWDTLENLKERVEAIQDSNESQISSKLSHIMKTLTIISVLTFPLTLFAAIFSMNLPDAPLENTPYGFWIVTGAMSVILIGMLAIFKKKRWF